MKRKIKVILSYILISIFLLGCCNNNILAEGENNKNKNENNKFDKIDSEHYTDEGIPIVRRQIFTEGDIESPSSSLKRKIKKKKSPKLGESKPHSAHDKSLPPSININNIVIFIRFKDEPEFITDENRNLFQEHYNGKNLSLKSYMRDISYNQFNVSSNFFPVNSDGKFYSYESKNSRQYYQSFKKDNPIGYKNEKVMDIRESILLSEAVAYCKPMLEQKYSNPKDLDFYGDDNIDNIVFVISGHEDTWDDLLWPHQYILFNKNITIYEKQVKEYNFMLESCFKKDNIGTLVHEFLHTKGFPDFYRYEHKGIPVGIWDLMSKQYPKPQFPLVYPRYKYGGFCNKPNHINSGGKYSLVPSTTPDYKKEIAYIIKSPILDYQRKHGREYFVIEYRAPVKYDPDEVYKSEMLNSEEKIKSEKDILSDDSQDTRLAEEKVKSEKDILSDDSQDTRLAAIEADPLIKKDVKVKANNYAPCWDESLPGEGLLVYRVNKDVNAGNTFCNGTDRPDNIFIFRKGITSPEAADGDIKNGVLLKSGDSLGVIEPDQKTKKYIAPKLEDTIYFSDGTNSGIKLYDINIDKNNKIASFKVGFANTDITKVKADKTKVSLDLKNKRILFKLDNKYNNNFISPSVEHNGKSIKPASKEKLMISDNMKYKVTSPTGMKQVWKVITSPCVGKKQNIEHINVADSSDVIINANILNKKGAKYQWYCDGKELKGEINDHIVLPRPKDKKFIKKPHKYYAVVSNKAGYLHCADTVVEWQKIKEEYLNHQTKMKRKRSMIVNDESSNEDISEYDN